MNPPSWRQIQRSNFTSWGALAPFLELEADAHGLPLCLPSFPLNLPRRLAEKIEKKNWQDPILLQFLPTEKEDLAVGGFVQDPVGDCHALKEAKLLHKYEGRVLFLATGACAMHCRYCFRKHFDYAVKEKGFDRELQLLEEDSSIKEVILSGGDPLSLSNSDLKGLSERFDRIPHLKRLRFHTRFPIGIPERIDQEFLDILAASRLQVYFIIHVNHPREWDLEVAQALKQIQKLGIPVLSQTVLLKGVNDLIDTLQDLCEQLVDGGVLPYYVHQLDRAAGTAHFEVEEERGIALIEELSKRVSGYALPRYVKEEAGKSSKTVITSRGTGGGGGRGKFQRGGRDR
ncbi:MAG: KamA family radical SAM protein [Chlamydiales bacterium]|nr:KamA family radical SAM protein [Chlamydiales bacterium]